MNLRSGFTLFELIIVIGLFAIAGAVAVFNISGQRSGVGLASEAESLVLMVEEAKSRARAGSDYVLGARGQASEYRGVYLSSTSGVFDNLIIGYVDAAASTRVGFYDGDVSEVRFNQLELIHGNINQVCGGAIQGDGSLSWTCSSSADTDGVHIVFQRSYEQEPDIYIDTTAYRSIRLDLVDGSQTKYIYVDTNGSSFVSSSLVSI